MVNGATNMATSTTMADIIIAPQLTWAKNPRCDLQQELKLWAREALKMGSSE